MLERLDAAVSAALQPVQTAMEGNAADEVVQPLAQVSPSNPGVPIRDDRSVILVTAASLLSGAVRELQRPAG